ncbi:MAG TPA: peptidoglycan-binding protein, partial [Paracoccaceae bacterium]|nr:peptidoglycan-binding protein [Paracoccaceae bacterium]
RYAGKTVILRFGSAGDLVRALQTRLGAALGRHVKVDGDFGPATFEAVLEFQLREFGPQADDGVVGPETAAALGLSLPLFDFEGAIAGDSGLATPAPVALGGSAAPAAANGPALAWGAVTGSKHGPAFKQKVLEIAARLGCDPSHLMAVMAFETGASFAPDKRNPVSGATGLIQFMRPTAEGLGTTQENLAAMTALGQLDFVERHIRQNARGLPHLSLSDLYMTVLLPSAVGKDEAHVLFQKPSTAYTQNAGLDRDGDGRITKLEATAKVQEALERGMQAANRG